MSADCGRARPGVVAILSWWVLAWALTAALLADTHYGSGDPDSKLYAGISARLVDLPVSQWIAPEWWGFWGLTGPYDEHPVGMFVVPAALGRLGYPAPQAAYAVNAFYQVASFVLVVLLARSMAPRRDADALGWLVQLLPIAFVFRIRANQEYAVLAGVLFALYACERARARPAWIGGMLAGFLAVLLVKGVFAFMVPLTCVLWLLARGPSPAARDLGADARAGVAGRDVSPALRGLPVAAWLGILLMPVAGVLATWGYESAYVHVTGRSFLEMYRARQVPEGALTAGSPVVRSAYNLAWYAGRVLWFAFPWSVAGAAVVVGALRRGAVWPSSIGSRPGADNGSGLTAHGSAPGADNGSGLTAHGSAQGADIGSRLTASGPRPGAEAAAGPASGSIPGTAWRGAWFAAAMTMALVVAFSLAHRKADRYIFPAYFSAAALGGGWAFARLPWLGRIADRLDRPWVPPAIHVALVLLRLATRGALPEFTFWRT